MTLRFDISATDGAARTAAVTTARGTFATPCFMPVGTRGAVRTLSSADLEDLGAEVVLGNTYHLMLRPGADVVERFGGIHGFADWRGHVLTDSGGYQVFSLGPALDDDGATFASTYDGSRHHLTPEGAVDVQVKLGSDIQMVLDVCAPLPSPPELLRSAVDRTALWAERARKAFVAHEREDLSQFGIVQGGTDHALRVESAERTVAVGFEGYAVGGLSVGEDRSQMLPALEVALDVLPADRPRYLMGLGDPLGMVDAVARGVDMFDCVLPTRLARHGTLLTSGGRINLRNRRYAADDGPLDPTCGCAVCARWSRGYLRHLLSVAEPTAPRLLTLHNVAWTLALVDRIRAAIVAGTLASLRAEVAERWSVPDGPAGHGDPDGGAGGGGG
ncbi:MAG TPA: tRNA guanosine(34) transglycosylase Tgt [Acidimicrobiales bacterium]|nr:tRNA guanosine(34) transglycosylase Tgt [Acidimicrobiales bacterium]